MALSIGRAALLSFSFAFSLPASWAQDAGQLHGNFSTDAQYYNEDEDIGAVVPAQRLAANAWMNLIYTNKDFEMGGRFESYEPRLAGYPAGQPYLGSGIGYRYAKYRMCDLEVTVGNYFEQFGQGMRRP